MHGEQIRLNRMFKVDLGIGGFATVLFVLAMTAAAEGVLIFAILSWRADELGKVGRYARQNWRTFGVSALVASALSLLSLDPFWRVRLSKMP